MLVATVLVVAIFVVAALVVAALVVTALVVAALIASCCLLMLCAHVACSCCVLTLSVHVAHTCCFFARRKAGEPPTQCVGHHPEGRCPAYPHEFPCVGPRGKRRPCAGLRLSKVDATARGPRSPSQDTATGTSPTWPPASGKVAAPRCPRTLVPATPAPAGDLIE